MCIVWCKKINLQIIQKSVTIKKEEEEEEIKGSTCTKTEIKKSVRAKKVQKQYLIKEEAGGGIGGGIGGGKCQGGGGWGMNLKKGEANC